MAITKQYRIEIQLDDARSQLEAATQKLEQLDAQLEGLDRNSDAAKAIVAQMATAAKQVDVLTKQVEGLGGALDDLADSPPPFPPGTLGALRKEAEQLEQQLDLTLKGTAEREALVAKLGQIKAELKDVDEAVDVAFDRDKAGAYVDAANGIAGAFEVATVAAQRFGLSEKDAQAYQQQLTEMIAVVQGLESVHRLTTSEVSTALKGLWGDAKRVIGGYFGIGAASTEAGAAATASANVTRIALASLGIGLVLVVLGLVAANWDRISAAVKRNKDQILAFIGYVIPVLYPFIAALQLIEKKFGSISAFVSGIGAAIGQAFRNLGNIFSGAEGQGKTVAEAFHEGVVKRNQELAEERERELLKPIIEGRARRIAVLEAEGRDVTALRARQLADEIKVMQVTNKEELKALRDKFNELLVLRAQFDKKRADEQRAQDVAILQAEITRRQAHGEAVLTLQLQQKELELQQLLTAVQRNEAAITAKRAEVEAARFAIQKDAADKASALHLARLNAQLIIEQAKGRDGVKQQLDIKAYELAQLKAAVQKNGAAIIAKQAEIDALRITAARDTAKKIADAELTEIEAQIIEAQARGEEVFSLQLKQKKKQLEQIIALEGENSNAAKIKRAEINAIDLAADRAAADNRQEIREGELANQRETGNLLADSLKDLAVKKAKALPDLGTVILTKLFGVKQTDVDQVKEQLNAAFAQVMQAGQLVNDVLFNLAKDQTDAQIERYTAAIDAAKARADQAEADLDAARQRREALEQNVDQQRGARREYTIAQIARERAAEERAARQKAAADGEEARNQKLKEAAEKRRQDLERKSQILAQATAVATNTATAASAVGAAVNAVRNANNVPFPGNLIAIVTALAATGAAIASAKQLGATVKGADGGLLEGPSHALGGIRGTGRFANVEVEGGEHLTKRAATANNLGTLATINKYGHQVQFVAVPRALVKGETGGQLSADGGLDVAGPGGGRLSVLTSDQGDQIISLLSQVAGHTQRAADKPGGVYFDGPTARRVVERGQQESEELSASKLF
jgi:hypothetical protein